MNIDLGGIWIWGNIDLGEYRPGKSRGTHEPSFVDYRKQVSFRLLFRRI